MSVALTTTYENSYFRRSIPRFFETKPCFHTTPHPDCMEVWVLD
jgi:hypothetical protein